MSPDLGYRTFRHQGKLWEYHCHNNSGLRKDGLWDFAYRAPGIRRWEQIPNVKSEKQGIRLAKRQLRQQARILKANQKRAERWIRGREGR